MTQLVAAHAAVSIRVPASSVCVCDCVHRACMECVQPDGASVVTACSRLWVCARYPRGWVLLADAWVGVGVVQGGHTAGCYTFRAV